MSKTQDKKAQRIADAQEFVAERRKMQLEILEQNYEAGVRIYEAQKDKLSPEEIEQIEAMKAEQRAALDKLREQINPGA